MTRITSRLYFKTLFWVIPITVGALLLTLLLSRYFMKKMLAEYVPALNVELAENAALKVEMFVQTAQVLLKSTSDVMANETAEYKRQLHVTNLLLSEPHFSSVYAIDSSGMEIANTFVAGIREKRKMTSQIKKALHGDVGYSSVYFSQDNIPLMEICVPIEHWREITGAVCGVLNFTTVWTRLDRIKVGRTGYTVLAAPDGTLLAHPDRTKVLKKEHVDSFLKNILHESRGSGFSRGSHPELVTFATIPGLNWKMIVRQSTQEVLGHYQAMIRYALTIMFVLIVVTAIFMAFFSFRLTQPILQLTEAAGIYASGNFNHRVNIHRNDEIGLLANAINHMFDDLVKNRNMLIQAEKLSSIGKFAASLAHELKTPIAGLSSYAYLLQEEITPDELREYAQEMLENLTRIDKTIEQLLNLSRQQEYSFSPIDINSVISRSIRLLNHHAMRMKKATIDSSLQESLPNITGNADLLQQVFVNILINACESIPVGGQIAVATRQQNEHVVVEIRDTGTGIPIEDIELIFEPFHTTKSNGRNTGLGLYIAREIMNLHGGKIHVSSNNGVGTVFTLVFEANPAGGSLS